MSLIGHGPSGGGSRLTPRAKLYPISSGLRYGQNDDRFQLSLKTVIGTTTSSPNGFDSNRETNIFVYCAGPAAILSHVAEDLTISQRLFRAKPTTLPLNATPSFYNPSTPPTTPTRNRHASPLKDASYTSSLGTPSAHQTDMQGSVRAQNRIREATCVSLGAENEILAVGETGYSPRVLIFSTSPESLGEVPLSILSDHSFGVQCVALSKNCKWLCTLGNTFDGFLLLYSLNPKTGTAKLHSSNKCSNVHAVIWMGDSIISYGTRHVKVWRIQKPSSPTKGRSVIESPSISLGSPGPKILAGRNYLLGSLIDTTFTAACAVSDSSSILGTNQGHVCILEGDNQKIESLAQLEFSIVSLEYDTVEQLIWIGGNAAQLIALPLDTLIKCEYSMQKEPTKDQQSFGPGIVALGIVSDHIISISTDKVIELKRLEAARLAETTDQVAKVLPAHESAALGICSLMHWQDRGDRDILTFSAQGTILLWSLEGSCTGKIDSVIEQASEVSLYEPNELKAVAAAETDGNVFVGDKRGLLRVVDLSGNTITSVQAHSGDINGIATTKLRNNDLVCTCGRDRTLQLFELTGKSIQVVQTLDDHAASVTDAQFFENGSTLISASADRSISVRKSAFLEDGSFAFLPVRVITLKTSPTSFAVAPFDSNTLIASTMDRQIQQYDMSTGRLLQSFKPTDPASNESVMTAHLQVATIESPDGPVSAILAASSTDKSIRLHDYDSGALLAREHGQATVSAVKLIQMRSGDNQLNYLVSCGMDGTVIVYSLTAASSSQQYTKTCESPIRAESPLKQTPASAPPTRKTLTKSEIAEFQKSLESSGDTVTPLRSKSPSRVKKKTSRFSLSARGNATVNNTPNVGRDAFRSNRRSSQDHSSTSSSPKNTIKPPKPKSRPSLDPRRRSKSAANLNDLNMSAEQLSDSLRTFRKRVTTSVTGKVRPEVLSQLFSELQLTLQAVKDIDYANANTESPPDPMPAGDAFETYIAKMIDERLALKTGPEQNQEPVLSSGSPGARKIRADEQAQAGAGE